MPTERHRLNTLFGILAAALWLAIVETYTIFNKAKGDTESATLRSVGQAQPFIIFMMMMLMGHLWAKRIPVAVVGFICGVLFWPLEDAEEGDSWAPKLAQSKTT